MRAFLLACVSFLAFLASAQNTIGLPEILNFSNQDYHGGTQTWSIKQAKNGVLFFANNDGLLSFDGNFWKLYPLPNRTIVRCLVIDTTSGNIYVGSQGEIGFFSPSANGELTYTSLKRLIPEDQRDFADIWHIEIHGNAVFFRANRKIFQYKNGAVSVFKGPSELRYMKRVGSRLFAQDRDRGILEYREGDWQPLCDDPVLKDGLITGIVDYHNDTLLVTTLKNGVFLLYDSMLVRKTTVIDSLLSTNRIYCAVNVNNEEIAIGTTSGGCYIINRMGKLVQTLSRTEGLQNNYILCLFLDKGRNLWMGLDNGIDFVAYNTPVKRILPDTHNQLAGYAIRISGKQLYIGTTDGLYSVPLDPGNKDLSFSKGDFTKIPNTNGQVWRIESIDRKILMGHHEGAFVVEDNQVKPLTQVPGTGSWLFAPLPSAQHNQAIVGTYTGLQLLQYDGGNFIDKGKIEGITESLRFIAVENANTVWSSHPYKGVYKIRLSENKQSLGYTLYTHRNGLPSDLNNYVFSIRNKAVVATQSGVYEYNAATDRFVPSSVLPPVFKGQSIQYLKEDEEGNIWFESDKKIGVIDYHHSINQESYSILYFPELTNILVRGFEFIYPYNAENVFIGSEKGVYHLNYARYLSRMADLGVLVSKVRIIGKTDSVIYGGFTGRPPDEKEAVKAIRLPNSLNSIHFEYSSPQYEQEKNIEYSYKLMGYEDQWSSWTKKTEKDYTNLTSGTYTFMVKARTNLGNESVPVSYVFEIRPAWYQTAWAYVIYLLVLLISAYVLMKWQRKKFRQQQEKYAKEQEHLRYMHQLEVEHNEREIIKLQNDKLESEVSFKNKELANATMHLVERGKVLSGIKEELLRLQKSMPGAGSSTDFKRLIGMISDAEKNDNYWDQFAGHFDQVYGNYLSLLKARFPALTPTDLKLCAYLRVNLSSKEISQLMNISVRGVEIGRYRLRKKLGINTDETLFDFLINIREGGGQ